ncbi:MAG: hypothetical protein LBT84_05555 [Spirochaetia bacterium]|jgi:hypothetical protein|nr:hypothetical protein [Spirochaetia bacterium]
MNCEDHISHYLKRESIDRLPFLVKIHLLWCGKCRREIPALRKNLAAYRGIFPYAMKRDMSDSIMRSVCKMLPYKRGAVSESKWIISGCILLGSIFLMPFNNSMQWVRDSFGEFFDIPLTIVMGMAISLYITLFAASHLKNFGLRSKIDRILAKEAQ